MRYFIAYFIVAALLIMSIVLILKGGRQDTTVPSTVPLTSYASTDAIVSLAVDGPINAASEHETILISADRHYVTYEELTGYNGQVRQKRRFVNTEAAYSNFLAALARAGFTHGNTDPAMASAKGHCPQGERYVYEITQKDKLLQHFWSTNCGGEKTYLGNASVTVDLFEAQVPDFDTLSEDVSF